ncbi:hypothetical protein KEM54_001814 [Ascosphaera aggregata]|nr:hypothetical protein KEM54_001814 [Ascosphaera aggregata]
MVKGQTPKSRQQLNPKYSLAQYSFRHYPVTHAAGSLSSWFWENLDVAPFLETRSAQACWTDIEVLLSFTEILAGIGRSRIHSLRLKMADMVDIPEYPFLSAAHFHAVCTFFLSRIDAIGGVDSLGWSYAVIENEQDEDQIMLIISKEVKLKSKPASIGDIIEDCLEDGDDAIQDDSDDVPVLYIETDPPHSICDFYDWFVPSIHHSSVKQVGILGGITPSMNPITQRPASMVHPCNTPEALIDVAAGQPVSTVTYLFLWLGLVGNAVGLTVPKELYLLDG